MKHSDLVWTKLNFRRIIVFSPMNVGISGYSPLLDKCIWVRSFINDNQCKWDVSRQKSANMVASGQSNLSCWSKWPSIIINQHLTNGCFPTKTHGFSWFSHGFSWFFMVFHGFPMVFSCVFPWFPLSLRVLTLVSPSWSDDGGSVGP